MHSRRVSKFGPSVRSRVRTLAEEPCVAAAAKRVAARAALLEQLGAGVLRARRGDLDLLLAAGGEREREREREQGEEERRLGAEHAAAHHTEESRRDALPPHAGARAGRRGSARGAQPAAASRTPAAVDATPLRLTLSEYRISPQAVRVPAGRVEIVVRNGGAMVHRLEIRSEDRTRTLASSPPLRPGATARLVVDLPPGDVPRHVRARPPRHARRARHDRRALTAPRTLRARSRASRTPSLGGETSNSPGVGCDDLQRDRPHGGNQRVGVGTSFPNRRGRADSPSGAAARCRSLRRGGGGLLERAPHVERARSRPLPHGLRPLRHGRGGHHGRRPGGGGRHDRERRLLGLARPAARARLLRAVGAHAAARARGGPLRGQRAARRQRGRRARVRLEGAGGARSCATCRTGSRPACRSSTPRSLGSSATCAS